MVCPFLGLFLPPRNGISPISPAAHDMNQMGKLPLSDALKPFLGSTELTSIILPPSLLPPFLSTPHGRYSLEHPDLVHSPHIFVGFGMCFLSVKMLGNCGASHHGNPAVASIKETPGPCKVGGSRLSLFYRIKVQNIHFLPIGLGSRNWECLMEKYLEWLLAPNTIFFPPIFPRK